MFSSTVSTTREITAAPTTTGTPTTTEVITTTAVQTTTPEATTTEETTTVRTTAQPTTTGKIEVIPLNTLGTNSNSYHCPIPRSDFTCYNYLFFQKSQQLLKQLPLV